ncbi:MAG: LLM class flavin-dependent oxidoreductase, partial [Candidatus Rokubacteria bacterium]|nr:LLM class flavin-dependent oxidoreductase [Candidatus Rokubacteria bacterium]
MGSSWTDSLGVAFLGVDVPRHVAAWARAAERAGLGSLWLIEDYFYPGAFALAGAAAAVTERAVVGLGVVNPYTRHPALLAMETAALAGLAPGRVVLGLGASNRVWIEERMGIPFTAPLESVREGVEIVRRLLAGERLTFRGRRFAVDAVRLESAPEQAVPIFLGVKG